jgi:LPS sulfotransferase NodH
VTDWQGAWLQTEHNAGSTPAAVFRDTRMLKVLRFFYELFRQFGNGRAMSALKGIAALFNRRVYVYPGRFIHRGGNI